MIIGQDSYSAEEAAPAYSVNVQRVVGRDQ